MIGGSTSQIFCFLESLLTFHLSREELNPEETDETARRADVRIHIECAIGRIKNYHVLDGNFPLSMTPLMNQVFTVYYHLYKKMKLIPVNA